MIWNGISLNWIIDKKSWDFFVVFSICKIYVLCSILFGTISTYYNGKFVQLVERMYKCVAIWMQSNFHLKLVQKAYDCVFLELRVYCTVVQTLSIKIKICEMNFPSSLITKRKKGRNRECCDIKLL